MFDSLARAALMSAEAAAVTPELVAEHGLTPDEYDRVLSILGREPSLTELGIFSVMWSEHCSYKSSKVWLKNLPTEGPQVIQGPGENAGVVDLGDGHAAIFKMESHNHPSFIEPYQGAATGRRRHHARRLHDGRAPRGQPECVALRRSGSSQDPASRLRCRRRHRRLRQLRRRSDGRRRGQFRPGYNGNILVNAMCVGLADADRIFYSAARASDCPSSTWARRPDATASMAPPWPPPNSTTIQRREAPDRAGRRPVHREAADRGLSRADGARTRSSPFRTWAPPG